MLKAPLYLSLVDFDTWSILNASVYGCVQPLPPTVHTGRLMYSSSMSANTTWMFAHVDDETQRAGYHLAKMEREREHQKGGFNTDLFNLLEHLSHIITGDFVGYAFNSGVPTVGDQGMALAALLVARYTNKDDNVWDVRTTRHQLLCLPMATVGWGRNYVTVAEQSGTQYETVVETMENITYLVDDCVLLYDRQWMTTPGESSKLAVQLSLVCASASCGFSR